MQQPTANNDSAPPWRTDSAFIKMALAYSDEPPPARPEPPIDWLKHSWNNRKITVDVTNECA